MAKQTYSPHKSRVDSAERTISVVLQVGVVLSAVILLAGLIIYVAEHASMWTAHGNVAVPYRSVITKKADYPHSMASLLRTPASLNGVGVMTVGLLLLILTPILRVGSSVFLFLFQKDRGMLYVTLFVFIVLISSFILGAFTAY